MPTLQEQIDFVLGPQVPLGNWYFDQIQVSRGKTLGNSCPAIPPSDPTALNDYELHLQYYDLPLSLHIAYGRTGDPAFVALARNAADSWWQHPNWIGKGTIRLWPDSATPPPRHAGIGGLMLRAMDGRPELWDWITEYVKAHLNIWLKLRINNATIYTGIREGAFALHYATWLAFCLPDSYPLQAGGTGEGAQTRAQLLNDIEAIVVNYHGRLQQSDGSWRWDDVDVKDPDGGTLVGITQPFQIGLLLCALCDVHKLTSSSTVKDNVKNQILKGCRHLYSDGPYRKDELIPYDPTKRRRSFWYLYHGGTTVNPTKFELGGWGYPGNDITEIQDERQAIGPVVAAYGYAYKISGDPFFKTAGDELWDSAYGPTDGIHNFFDTDGKGYNQNARRAGSYQAWAGSVTVPVTSLPTGTATPTTSTTPTTTTTLAPSPDGTKATSIVDNNGSLWTFGLEGQTLKDGVQVGRGGGSIYKWFGGTVYVLGTDNNWYRWTGSAWELVGPTEPGTTATTPTPIPTPVPVPIPCSISAPSAVTIPKWGAGKISVTVNNMTGPTTVNVIGSSGQVAVSPLTKTVSGTSSVMEFGIKVKQQSRTITFDSPCGRVDVKVNVV